MHLLKVGASSQKVCSMLVLI